jgi:hypothetical protein
MAMLKETVLSTRAYKIVRETSPIDTAAVVRYDLKSRISVSHRLILQTIQVSNLHHSYIGVEASIINE